MDNTPAIASEPGDDINAPAIVIEAPICPAATVIANRIKAERERLAAEEKIERELADKRKALLVDGSDAQVDDCERRIDASRSAQVRILERIDLLAPQIANANEAHRAVELDALTASANKARESGEKLIREYEPHAEDRRDPHEARLHRTRDCRHKPEVAARRP